MNLKNTHCNFVKKKKKWTFKGTGKNSHCSGKEMTSSWPLSPDLNHVLHVKSDLKQNLYIEYWKQRETETNTKQKNKSTKHPFLLFFFFGGWEAVSIFFFKLSVFLQIINFFFFFEFPTILSNLQCAIFVFGVQLSGHWLPWYDWRCVIEFKVT